jgi:peptidoglycan/LPS O-acetylase OafA/YrhL
MNRSANRRLVELDALRGIAAMLVMLFHYTTRYAELYGHESAPYAALPWGHYGVNLFFMISGFVIFMTLHRVRRPMDFVVSRFSRLFPTYWVAVIVTFLLTRALALPDKTVSAGTAAMNLFMIHGLAGIPHVDGVYWTLEIELIFYAMALALYRTGWLDRVHAALLGLLALRLVYFLAEKFAGIELSWTLSHLLILPYIAWFVCGIMIYRRMTFPDDTPRKDMAVLLAAIGQLAIVDGPGIGLLAASLSLLFWMAATGRLPWLANPVMAWLGAISYTLYLLHENIGWGVMLQLERAGFSANLAIVLAIAIALSMASALTWLIERPAMRWIRTRYRQHEWPIVSLGRSIALIGLVMTTFFGLTYAWHRTHPKQTTPGDYVANIQLPSELTAIPCRFDAEPRPLMILVLGQSNAGNHGELATDRSTVEPTTFFFEGKCYRTTGPAPGATGTGGNIWTAMAPKLAQAIGRPVIFSVLAVESTRIRDWVKPGKLQQRLIGTLAEQRHYSFMPDLALWQQGEADAQSGITRAQYLEQFTLLVKQLRNNGVTAPLLAALSTHCKNTGSEPVRNAILAVSHTDPSVLIGPDTDVLVGPHRINDCHFTSSGIDASAELWKAAIINLVTSK